MTTAVFKKVDYTLDQLLNGIELGTISLPDIQRPFVWKAAKVRDLFDSMYQGFPVGYLLFWKNDTSESGKAIGVDIKQKPPELLIVDGQQRLTSLFAVLGGKPIVWEDYAERRIFIAFNPLTEVFEVADAAIRNDAEYIADISQLWVGGLSEYQFVKRYLEELRTHREVDQLDEDRIVHAISRLNELEKYPFTALELDASLDEEKVADVFVRVNSQGVTLNQADFILTLMSVFWEKGRVQLEDFCRAARVPAASGPSPFNHFITPSPDQLLRVGIGVAFQRGRLKNAYNVLRGKDMESGEFSPELRGEQFALLAQAQDLAVDLTNWHEFMKCLMAAGYASGAVLSSENALLYTYVLYLLGRHEYGVDHGKLRTSIARWFFMSGLTGRYTNSPETRIEEDLARLRDAETADDFLTTLQGQVDGALTNDFWEIQLPNDLSTSASRGPSLYAFYAAQKLLAAPVLFSSLKVSELLDPAIKAKKSALERHHLFPRAYLRKIGVTSLRDINQIANFALVEWADNIDIRDDPPTSYVPSYEQRVIKQSGEDALHKMYEFHALPLDWASMEYKEFLVERRKLIAGVIRRGYERIG